MRFVRIDRLAPGGAAVELHPRLTVVAGAPPELRRRLLQTMRAVVGDAVPECGGMIEVSGVRLALDRPTLDQLRMDPRIDPVLGFTALPEPTAPAPPPADQWVSSTVGLDGDRSDLRADLRQVTTARTRLGARMEEVRQGLDSFSRASLDVCRGQIEALEARRSALRAEREALRDERVARRTHLLGEIAGLRTALAEVGDADPTAVRAAVEQLASLLTPSAEPDPEALRLASELTAAMEVLTADARRRDEIERRLSAVDQELVDAREALAHAEATSHAPLYDAEVVRRLEQVRDEIFSSDDRSGLLGSTRGKRRIQELRAEEAVLLDRLGFDTYSAYVMGIPSVRSDLARSDDLDRARRRVAAAEEAAGAARAQVAADEAAVAVTPLEDVVRLLSAADVLMGEPVLSDESGPFDEPGHERGTPGELTFSVRPDDLAAQAEAVAARLRARRRRPVDLGDPRVRHATTELETALRVVVGAELAVELGAAQGDVVAIRELAERWLAGGAQRAVAAAELGDRMRALESELEALDAEPEPEFDVARLAHVEAELDAALDRLGEAEDRVRAHEEAMDRLADLRSEELVLRERERELLAAVSATESGATFDAPAADRRVIPATATPVMPSEPPPFHEGGLERPGPAQDAPDPHWRLISRLAEQRSVSFVGSIPMVLDGLPADRRDRDRVLERVGVMSDVVQVVILSDDRAVADLVGSAALDGAVVRIL